MCKKYRDSHLQICCNCTNQPLPTPAQQHQAPIGGFPEQTVHYSTHKKTTHIHTCMKACWVCNDAPFPASPLCPLGVDGGIAFSSLRDRDRSAKDTLRAFFLSPAVFADASCSRNANITRTLL